MFLFTLTVSLWEASFSRSCAVHCSLEHNGNNALAAILHSLCSTYKTKASLLHFTTHHVQKTMSNYRLVVLSFKYNISSITTIVNHPPERQLELGGITRYVCKVICIKLPKNCDIIFLFVLGVL